MQTPPFLCVPPFIWHGPPKCTLRVQFDSMTHSPFVLHRPNPIPANKPSIAPAPPPLSWQYRPNVFPCSHRSRTVTHVLETQRSPSQHLPDVLCPCGKEETSSVTHWKFWSAAIHFLFKNDEKQLSRLLCLRLNCRVISRVLKSQFIHASKQSSSSLLH